MPRRPAHVSLLDYEPGDYGRRWNGIWWLCLPDSGMKVQLDDRWRVEEHEDGTISVHPSIHISNNRWHGWLTAGEFIQIEEVQEG